MSSSSDTVIDALAAALNANPHDTDMRMHLASVLLAGHRAAEALDHFATLLTADPANLEALRGAHSAATLVGEEERAAGYAKLIASLGGVASTVASDQADNPVEVEVKVEAEAEARDEEEEDNGNHNVAALAQAQSGSEGSRPTLRVVGGRDAADPDVEADTARTRVTLDDVAGLKAVKKRIDVAFLGPLRNPDLAKAYGKRLRGGLLLYGPPGCGKTYIARALAGELRADFISIGLNDVLNMWIGESEQRLHALFERARESAPTVVFMDELDALGRKRGDVGSNIRSVVNQLLQELDGVGTEDDAVFVLGATNLPWDIDVALKRPGRFDRAIFVEPPDLEARQRILELNFADRPVEKVDFKRFAKKTKGFSGADIAFLCEAATELAMERAMDTGEMAPISSRELDAALSETRPSVRPWFETARNYATFANASGEYNDLAEYIDANRL